jgi:hypothetical protein
MNENDKRRTYFDIPCVDPAEIEATAATSEPVSYAELPGRPGNSHVSSERPGRITKTLSELRIVTKTKNDWEGARQRKIPTLRGVLRRVGINERNVKDSVAKTIWL